MRTPLSLEDIARENRRRHDEEGGVVAEEDGGPLELEVRLDGGGGRWSCFCDTIDMSFVRLLKKKVRPKLVGCHYKMEACLDVNTKIDTIGADGC